MPSASGDGKARHSNFEGLSPAKCTLVISLFQLFSASALRISDRLHFSATAITMKRAFTAAYLLAKRALFLETRQDRFRRYALLNKWGSKESVSGPGSTLAYTARLRAALPSLFDEFSIKTVLDAPCGDYNWMRLVKRPGVEYIGGEIVPELVDANNARYRDESTRFIHCDIVQDELPAADLWMWPRHALSLQLQRYFQDAGQSLPEQY